MRKIIGILAILALASPAFGDGLIAGCSGGFCTSPLTSAQFAALITDETGTGVVVFGTSPNLTTPTISGSITQSAVANTTDLLSTGYSLTGSNISGMILMTGTLNTSGANFDVIKYSITNTAVGTNVGYFSLFAGSAGTTKEFGVDLSGNVVSAGSDSAASLIPTGSSAPAVGFYSASANRIDVSTNSNDIWTFGNGFINYGATISSSASSTGPQISANGATCTSPVYQPNKAGSTYGWSSDATPTKLCAVIAGVEKFDVSASGLFFLGTIPGVTGTGTPSITTGSTDTAGEVTGGVSATSIVITFAASKTNAPFCTVTSQTQLAAFTYTISTTAITITETATTGDKIDYVCLQH